MLKDYLHWLAGGEVRGSWMSNGHISYHGMGFRVYYGFVGIHLYISNLKNFLLYWPGDEDVAMR